MSNEIWKREVESYLLIFFKKCIRNLSIRNKKNGTAMTIAVLLTWFFNFDQHHQELINYKRYSDESNGAKLRMYRLERFEIPNFSEDIGKNSISKHKNYLLLTKKVSKQIAYIYFSLEVMVYTHLLSDISSYIYC